MHISSIKSILVIILCIFLLPAGESEAQGNPAAGPVYIVQEGDSLWNIAYRFHVSQEALANANGITDADQISIGQQLIIPGLEGLQGILTTETVKYGDSVQSLSLQYQLSPQMLKRLNHITSPSELYAGYSLVIVNNESPARLGKRVTLEPSQSLLELAVLNNTDLWSLMAVNHRVDSWTVIPGEVIRSGNQDEDGPGGLPSTITDVSVSELVQGQTALIQVAGESDLKITGALGEWKLNFFPESVESYISLQGVHAMAEPGLYPLTLEVATQNSSMITFTQMALVYAGDFLYDRSLPVDPVTLDPETNRAENELWSESASGVTPDKLWQGSLYIPVEPVFAECYASRFGSRRSYNGGAYDYFHTGIDFCGQVGDPIYAAAPGVVVYAGLLKVRGNATMIDHGRGVFTAYMHQSEILVSVGEHVEAGQLIGRVGNTGRVEGPHLHFEVLVGGVQVNPLDWLDGEFP